MPHLFDPLELRGSTLRNRVGMSPMCQYSAPGGVPTSWHIQHLGARAAGGCGIVFTEATAVEPRGRISLLDTGIWTDAQAEAWRPIAALIAELGALPCMQLAHAGRKAGTAPPWDGGKPYPRVVGVGADLVSARGHENKTGAGKLPPYAQSDSSGTSESWTEPAVAPSAIAFSEAFPDPHELTSDELPQIVQAFVDGARRAVQAGFGAVELHMAHGYLLHSFYSPLSNQRADEYGSSIENRMQLPLELAAAVRAVLPEDMPLLARISATDWADGGWDVEDSVVLAGELQRAGVDLVDCSSGGAVPAGRIQPVAQAQLAEPLYQVPLAQRVREGAEVPTAAVGLITTPQQAAGIVAAGQADLVLLGRELLRHPHWCLDAARELGSDVRWPKQYERAK